MQSCLTNAAILRSTRFVWPCSSSCICLVGGIPKSWHPVAIANLRRAGKSITRGFKNFASSNFKYLRQDKSIIFSSQKQILPRIIHFHSRVQWENKCSDRSMVVYHSALYGNYDGKTNRPTDQRTDRPGIGE